MYILLPSPLTGPIFLQGISLPYCQIVYLHVSIFVPSQVCANLEVGLVFFCYECMPWAVSGWCNVLTYNAKQTDKYSDWFSTVEYSQKWMNFNFVGNLNINEIIVHNFDKELGEIIFKRIRKVSFLSSPPSHPPHNFPSYTQNTHTNISKIFFDLSSHLHSHTIQEIFASLWFFSQSPMWNSIRIISKDQRL